MTTRIAWCVGLCVLVAGCGGAPADGTVNGKVAFADGTPATGVAVALSGQTVAAATTDGSGHYTFTKVVEGAYVLSADVPGTLERHAQVVVSAGKTAVTVPTLTFTAVGTVSGTVVDATGSPAEGAEVRVLGTDRAASTDATGAFTLDRVATGDQSLMASFGAGADRVTGSAQVTVKRGETATASLTLAAPPPPPPAPEPGTVTGTVTYPLAGDASTITVTAVGTSATAHPSPDGSYSLDLPPGTYRLDATAPAFPAQTLGQAQVRSGQTVALAPKLMSISRPLPLNGGGAWLTMPGNLKAAAGGRVLLYQRGGNGFQLYAVDLDTLALHPIAALPSAPTPSPVLGPQGKQVSLYDDSSLYVVSIDAGTVVTAPVDVGYATGMVFGQDGKSVLVAGTVGVDRLDLGTGQLTQVAGTGVQQVGPDAFLVQTATASGGQTWALVTGAGVTQKIFDGVAGTFTVGRSSVPSPLPTSQAALALAQCANPSAGCPVVELPPGATATVPVTLPDGSAYTATDNPIAGPTSSSRWLILMPPAGASVQYLLDTGTGKTVAMPYSSTPVYVSPDGSELAIINGTKDGMYVGPASAPFAGTEVHGTALRGTFVSDDTFVAFDDSATPRRLVFQGGAAPSVDTRYQSGSGQTRRAMAWWTRPSTGDIAVRIGPSAAVDLPVAASSAVSVPGGDLDPTTMAPGMIGAVTTHNPTIGYVIDGNTGTVRTYPGIEIYGGVPGAFTAGGLGSQLLEVPADGGVPLPVSSQIFLPEGMAPVAPASTVMLGNLPGSGPGYRIAVFPGFLPPPQF